MGHPFLKADRETIIGPGSPRSVTFNALGAGSGNEFICNLYRASLLLTALLIFGVGRASADTLLSYSFSGTNSVSFELPVNPTPTGFTLGIDFLVTPIDLMINGAPSSDTLQFFSSTFGGAFAALSCPSCVTLSLTGPQLYSGSEANPTMLVVSGVTLLNDMGGTPAGTVTSTPTSTTTTPEPSVTVLLGVGLLAIGMAVLRFKPNFGVSIS
jgi:hypothetical protein